MLKLNLALWKSQPRLFSAQKLCKIMMKDDAMVWFHVDDDADDDDDDDHDDDHDNDDIKDTFQLINIQILQCHHIQNQTRFRLPGSFCFLWWGLPCRTHQLADFLLTTRFLSMSIVWAQSIVLQCDRKIKESILVKWPGRIGILTIAHNILEYLWHFFEILNSASLCLKCCYSVTYIWRFFSQIDREGSSH